MDDKSLREWIVKIIDPKSYPITKRKGGFDSSTITCGCSCHIVYGSRSKRKITKSTCDHCRVYGQ